MDKVLAVLWIHFPHPIASNRTQAPHGTTHSCSVGSLNRLRRVYRSTGLLILVIVHIRLSTRNILTRKTGEAGQVIVKSIEPHGTIVSGQTPFSDNNWTKRLLHRRDILLLLTSVGEKANTTSRIQPGLINMSIKSTIRTSSHKSSPYVGIKTKAIVHDIFPIGRMLLNDEVAFPVERLQMFDGSLLPGFIHGLQTEDGRMTAVRVHNLGYDSEGMVNVVVVDAGVIGSVSIERAHPFCSPNRPVLKRDEISRVDCQC
mmetsp:Transcript_10614/g.23002  ORF Transcript_10614/g.23002 Transcript_10614/m.23002 type:complete len:258 (+) Transcript_10614:830-1603(+)